jgi:hypothetical protein
VRCAESENAPQRGEMKSERIEDVSRTAYAM